MSLKQEKRQKLLQEFSSNVTLHGFRYLVEEKGIRRVIWFIITTGCFSLSIFFFQSILGDFLTYKSTTTITSVLDKTKADFPTITICPMNHISMSKIKNPPANITEKDFVQTLVLDAYISKELNFSDPVVKDLFKRLEKENITSYKDIMNLITLDLDEMVLNDPLVNILSIFNHYCNFEGKLCSTKNFTTVQIWETNSICSQFNSFDPKKPPVITTSTGIEGGLSITMNLRTNDSAYSTYPIDGLLVTLSNYGSQYQMVEHNKKFIIPVGSFSLIEINPKKIELLPEPYSTKCGTRDYKMIKNRPYSKYMCKLDCLLEIIYKKTGCMEFDVIDFVDVRMCSVNESMSYFKTRDRVSREFSYTCNKECPQECTRTTYSVSYSQANLGTNSNYNTLQKSSGAWKNVTIEGFISYIRRNYISVMISFSDMVEVQEVVTPSVTYTTLVGTIGGFLGLCLGVSFVSVMEFVLFIFDYFILSRIE